MKAVWIISVLSSYCIFAQTIEQRYANCTAASSSLVESYKGCFSKFPTIASNVLDADNGAIGFINCICDTNWRGGSSEQILSSVPDCPAIPGISKASQIAVAYDCLGSGISQKRNVVSNFGLRTLIGNSKTVYVPLAGLPPGMTTASSASLSNINMVLLTVAIILTWMH